MGGSDNQKHRPVMIHRAPFGSMERFVAILIESTAGDFPLWLAPEQIAVLPISEKYHEYAKSLYSQLQEKDIRGIIDEIDEKIGKKIRDAEIKKIPFMLIVGEQEAADGTVSLRAHGKGDQGSMKIEEFVKFFNQTIDNLLNKAE